MDIQKKKRIVIKLGTSTLTHATGGLNIRRVEELVKITADLHNSGKEIIIVSSGAVGLGLDRLNVRSIPDDVSKDLIVRALGENALGLDVPTKQAAAAIGQSMLMRIYMEYFGKHGLTVAQILLTKKELEDSGFNDNTKNTLKRLLISRVIPIINENDSVATEELGIGDNDTLSACAAKLIGADLLVILSDIDGLYDKDPHTHKDARLITEVTDISDIADCAAGPSGHLGTGGMVTKINAAKIAAEAGIGTVIMNGSKPGLLYDLFDGKPVGTVFAGSLAGKRGIRPND
ncbi:MAG: glutamate 5-kinase [Oscillospiraceae bacterium]|jgi:glutamate 5-kinase|nr:glutamate 5-kinase [Oscillospiraceae bacterium]